MRSVRRRQQNCEMPFKRRPFTVARGKSCSAQVHFCSESTALNARKGLSRMQRADLITLSPALIAKKPLPDVCLQGGALSCTSAGVHACLCWNEFQKRNKHFSSQSAGLKRIKKKLFGANEDPFNSLKHGVEPGRCGGGGDFPRCILSHGIKMEAVGFLPLLSVICFLNTQKQKQHAQSWGW